jgi:hypothetical protein
MGLAGGYGAAAAGASIEDMVKQRILAQQHSLDIAKALELQRQFQQRTDLQQQELNQQNTQFGQRIGQEKAEFGQRVREYDEGAPTRTVNLRKATTEADTGDLKLTDTKKAIERREQARPAVDQKILGMQDAGIDTSPIDTQLGDKQKGAERLAHVHGAEARQTAAVNNVGAEKMVKVTSMDEAGNPVDTYMPASEAMGKSFRKPPPGGTPALQKARAKSAQTLLDQLESVHSRLQSGEGPGQLARGLSNLTGGYVNLNNDATEYQKLREATAVALAVAIQGSRPSDADAKAMARLLPDFTTPGEVAKNLFTSTREQLQSTAAAMGGDATGDTAAVSHDAPAQKKRGVYNPKTGKVEWQ